MRPLRSWFTARPLVADAALALFVVFVELVGTAGTDLPTAVYVALVVAVGAPIVVRRRHPVLAAWTALLLCQIGSALIRSDPPADGGVPEFPPGHLALIVLLFSCALYARRRDTALFAAGLVLDLVVITVAVRPDFSVTLSMFVLYALAWITAEFIGARRAYVAEVRARLAVAELERDRLAEEAVIAERTRIARELHDVVAHAVSVMIVQADGASFTLRTDPDRAEAALGNISTTGRRALAELRRTVSLLRTDESVGTPGTADGLPQYGTAALAKVVEMMRAAGLQVQIEQTGDLDDLPPAVSLGVHRLVQESLTNVLRHGGEQPRARVVVRRESDENAVIVQITNWADTDAQATTTSAALQGTGFGVIGMRERVAVLGGELTAGRLDDGRWRVSASLPLEQP